MPNSLRTILLVEDNPDDADLAMRALKMNNIRNRTKRSSERGFAPSVRRSD
jgi:hypothetical protein